jgi:hypothetical protein
MNLTQKISQMTPKGADLDATDLIEVSTIVGGSYVTKSITGQELIDAIPLPPTGLTVGTTPISSGTIGRVLFQGTGNVLQQSSSLFWDSTNNRLGIGTETPASRLHIGTTVGSLATGLTFGSGVSGIWMLDNTTMGIKINSVDKFWFRATDFYPDASLAIDLGLPSRRWRTLNTQQITDNGSNVLINTTTDAGFRLDVNGTARMGTLRLLNTSDTLEFANTLVRIRRVANTMFLDAFNGFTFFDSTSSLDRVKIFANGNFAINTTTDAGFRLDVNGTARVSGDVTSTGSFITTSQVGYSNNSRTITFNDAFAGLNYQGFGGHRFKSYNSSTALYVEMITLVGNQSNLRVGINSPTPNSSAILDVVSTDKGFLPPRMTTTQKNAIASPATGLQVYDTTLNRPCFYDGTTWITL